jgi:cyclophilin family peptidyl-prolyl cis-trans isomerase
MPNRRTRERQLAKLAERRAAARRKKSRQRVSAIAVSTVIVVAAGVFVYMNLPSTKAPTASGSPTPASSLSPSPSPGAVACGGKVPADAGKKKATYPTAPKKVIQPGKSYTATMVTSCGTIEIALDTKLAPNTVNSIVFLAEHHFYDGLTFHRIAKGFVIQGGDPIGDGSGGPGYSTLDKPPASATYPIGTIAMAKTQTEPAGTSGSQFFIVLSKDANAALAPAGQGPLYAIVGHVTKGLDVVNKIAELAITGGSGATDGAPVQKVYIVKVTIKAS